MPRVADAHSIYGIMRVQVAPSGQEIIVGMAGGLYFAGALALGFAYLFFAVRFWSQVSDLTARHLLRASFVYLPAILMLLLLNPMPA